jgi:uncharacterized protein YdeI (YjbR/CyaY-like superfamily)
MPLTQFSQDRQLEAVRCRSFTAIKLCNMSAYKEALTFTDRKAWRSWLDTHFSDENAVWIVIQKKHSTLPGLFLDDAVKEALCFGWIDSTLNTRDDDTYYLRFSQRKPDSVWSMTNIRRVEKLERNGSMKEPGLTAVRAAKDNGQWQAAIDRENPEIIPPDLEAALRRTKGAVAAYRNLPDSKKKQYVYWVQRAKRMETKKKRIGEIVKLVLLDH